jgi:hypothetical protein
MCSSPAPPERHMMPTTSPSTVRDGRSRHAADSPQAVSRCDDKAIAVAFHHKSSPVYCWRGFGFENSVPGCLATAISVGAFIQRPRPTTARMIPPRRWSIGLNSADASKPLLISRLR